MSQIPGLVFKGGTSLSKCYKLIDRFSEDIDLTLDTEHYTQGRKRKSVKDLILVFEKLDLSLLNREEIEQHTHGTFNCYRIQYPILFPSEYIKSELKVEMTYIQKPYPCEMSQANSYIGEFFQRYGDENLIVEYGFKPFNVQVQTLERTLIDKIFAICDYYLSGNTIRNSRHIYDISRLLTRVELSSQALLSLIDSVRNERQSNRTCLSAKDEVDVPKLLQNIIDTAYFKRDYIENTEKLLRTPCDYCKAIQSLEKIIASGVFKNK